MRVIVAGAGETGHHVARLLSAQHDVVIIDWDTKRLSMTEEALDALTLHGNCTSRKVLRRAEVGRATGFVAVTNDGTANVLSAALARGEGAAVAVARMDAPGFYETSSAVERDVLGVSHVLCPARLAANEILRVSAERGAVAVQDAAFGTVQIAVVELGERSPATGQSPASEDVGDEAVLGAVIRDGQIRSPVEIPRFEAEDRLVIAGPHHAVADARQRMILPRERRRILVVGAGDTGTLVSAALARQGLRVGLVDTDSAVCERAAAELPNVLVLHGDGSSPAFLRDQQIESVAAVVAVTGEDQSNLMVSLLARQLGVSRTYIEVHRPGYSELYAQLGFAGTVGAYGITAHAAVRALRREPVVGASPVPETAYSLVEVQLQNIGASTVAALRLPSETHPVCRIHAGRVSPAPATAPLESGDTLVVLHPTRHLKQLAQIGGAEK